MPDFSDFLLAVDYDRTLTAPDSTIPVQNLEAIQYFMKNGGKFTVNTGRSIPMYQCIRTDIPVNVPLILYNGGALFDTHSQELSNIHYIDLPMRETLKEVISLFPNLTVELQGKHAHYTFSENYGWNAFYNQQHVPHQILSVDDVNEPFMKFTVYASFQSKAVSDLFRSDPADIEKMDRAEETLRKLYGQHVEVYRSAARIIDVHPKGVSKLRAARDLQHTLGCKYLVCVGDAKNDINMLDGADFSFCPSDGVVADRYPNVCPCGEGSIAEVIYQKIPGIIVGNS